MCGVRCRCLPGERAAFQGWALMLCSVNVAAISKSVCFKGVSLKCFPRGFEHPRWMGGYEERGGEGDLPGSYTCAPCVACVVCFWHGKFKCTGKLAALHFQVPASLCDESCMCGASTRESAIPNLFHR